MNSEMIPKIHRRISLTKISSQAFKEARSPNVDLLILYFYLNLALCSLRIQQYYRKADAIILTFDCTERSSFYNIESWIQQINAKAQNDVLKIIVSNKIDITHRDITFEEGEKIAKDYNWTYFETSAKTGHNINALFQTVAESLLESDACKIPSFHINFHST